MINCSNGAVSFKGSLEVAYRACLWSRFAARILMQLFEFSAPDTDALYQGAGEVDWNEHFSVNGTFAVDCTLRNSPIKHSRYAALRVKDAIVDQFRNRMKRRPSIDVERPDIQVHAILDGKQASICLDFSGESLHRRGYRKTGGEAPLKETLAAAIVHLSGWANPILPESILVDPMCGSGTLLIEAALMYGDIAPGLGRKYFGFLKWRGHRIALWKELTTEARERRRQGLKRPWPKIVGYDASRTAVRGAVLNIQQAGFSNKVHVERRELARLQNPLAKKMLQPDPMKLVVVNPPYGERMGTLDAARYLYRCMGRKLREQFAGWKAGIFCSHKDLAYELGMDPIKRYRLFNGPIACDLSIFDVTPGTHRTEIPDWKISEQLSVGDAEDFANRLRKNFKNISRWAKREGISCYRIYDADIPEYNVVVDVYEKWVHLQEYAPPSTVDPDKATRRLKQAVQGVQDVLGVGNDQIFVKVRQKQKANAQYQKKDAKGCLYEVHEHNCQLLVNLTDYLDTGLFLDHRITRNMIQNQAHGKHFLNLFGYSGTASVHAAMGGAKTTTTVDLSSIYLAWARSNLALNGFSGEHHRFVRSDCMVWLTETREQFDLIFTDPPTFSNTRNMHRIFDVQRDHVDLIRRVLRRLEPGGLLIFSTNFRNFKMNLEALSEFELENITSRTIPRDFKRSPRIHQCWQIRRRISA